MITAVAAAGNSPRPPRPCNAAASRRA